MKLLLPHTLKLLLKERISSQREQISSFKGSPHFERDKVEAKCCMSLVNVHKYFSILATSLMSLKQQMSLCFDILIFMSKMKFMLSSVEHERSFITSRPELYLFQPVGL